MASAKCEPIMGARGLAELLVVVRWGQSPPPPEAESLVACARPMETAILPHSLYFGNSIHKGLRVLCIFDVFRKTIMSTFE